MPSSFVATPDNGIDITQNQNFQPVHLYTPRHNVQVSTHPNFERPATIQRHRHTANRLATSDRSTVRRCPWFGRRKEVVPREGYRPLREPKKCEYSGVRVDGVRVAGQRDTGLAGGPRVADWRKWHR